ncbi:MAG: rRNA maturation RNase YbeY [Oscillospiraceae bacterium]|jgi:probable rRNA maturation factor|nr:rRNA maturation RNase YbeY [Oscillospiraceae bacterium]
MASKVKVIITDDQQEIKIPTGIRMLLRRACTAVLVQEKFPETAEVSVRFIDDIIMQSLNKAHRGIDDTTDVLSFPLGENGIFDKNLSTGALVLGDIVISLPRALHQAKLYGHTLQRELAFLTVHSMMHLLGYHHESGGLESVRMREKEEAVLVKLGLPRGHNYTLEE